ncbi:lactonase family protein [Kitasatospora viridis]|uniref:6-phosphogluconolactonase (Cycloisomerase 2 family) n=1 Tax=Kitasatospora viridis TaxID=281105 RepID=A0A561UQB1_9ACTN|nr:beta-propeller fold lactonase family protein [Kitasatospora viridis]TWG01548.1 6-phosphogluconolactonase (cycloisomerase 2 family) [Kitasatospora viridis]
MNKITRIGVSVAAALALAGAFAPAASAADAPAAHPVFVQTDNPGGNQVVAYHRSADGKLTQQAVYPTGGRGGVLQGSVADHTASQGALAYDAAHRLLYAVNAGSNTVSVFSVQGEILTLRQVLPSGGEFPVGFAVHGDRVYVLDALGGGAVQGYRVVRGQLETEAGWHRALGLDPNAMPQFTHTPAQIGFLADGSQLVVTTKGNGSSIAVFGIDHSGAPSPAPVVTGLPGAVPFGFVPDGRHGLFVTEVGTNSLAAYRIGADGRAVREAAADTGQAAVCWVVRAGDVLYTSNAGSSTLTGVRATDHGSHLAVLGNTPTDPGTVDAAATPDGRHLYVQTGVNGIVDEFTVEHDGSLTRIGAQTVPGGAGGEGIVAL